MTTKKHFVVHGLVTTTLRKGLGNHRRLSRGRRWKMAAGVYGRWVTGASCNSFSLLSVQCKDTRVNFTVDVTDANGTLRFTAFAEDCEKLIGLPTSEIYEKKMAGDWPEFEEIATNLKAIHFQIAPTTSLTRIRVLKWALKDVSFD